MNGAGLRPGWLVDQLPRSLAEDHFTQRFVEIFEVVAGTIRSSVIGFEHDLDARIAPPEFVRWMGGWLGLVLDPSLADERQRSVVETAGRLFPFRGTRRGVVGLLEAFTGSPVEVEDDGGVFREGQSAGSRKHAIIKVSDPGGIDESHLLELVRGELPADATFEVRVGRRKVREEAAGDRDLSDTLSFQTIRVDQVRDEGAPPPAPPAPHQSPQPPNPPKPPKPPKRDPA